MGQAQINVRTRACSRTSIARTKQAALTHNVRGKELTYNAGGNDASISCYRFTEATNMKPGHSSSYLQKETYVGKQQYLRATLITHSSKKRTKISKLKPGLPQLRVQRSAAELPSST